MSDEIFSQPPFLEHLLFHGVFFDEEQFARARAKSEQGGSRSAPATSPSKRQKKPTVDNVAHLPILNEDSEPLLGAVDEAIVLVAPDPVPSASAQPTPSAAISAPPSTDPSPDLFKGLNFTKNTNYIFDHFIKKDPGYKDIGWTEPRTVQRRITRHAFIDWVTDYMVEQSHFNLDRPVIHLRLMQNVTDQNYVDFILPNLCRLALMPGNI